MSTLDGYEHDEHEIAECVHAIELILLFTFCIYLTDRLLNWWKAFVPACSNATEDVGMQYREGTTRAVV